MTTDEVNTQVEESKEVQPNTEEILYPDKDVKVEEKVEKKVETEVSKEVAKDAQSEDSKSEIELSVSEGSDLTDEDVNSVKEFAKANNLSKEAAQKLLDEKSVAAKKLADKQNANLKEQAQGWLKEIKSSKTFDEDLKATQQVLAEYFDPEFKKLLNDSGLGNHPALFKGLAKLGKAMNPKPLVHAPKNAAAPKLQDWELFYGPDKSE
jgi:hypothetical protein